MIMAGCNCGGARGAGTGSRYKVTKADGSDGGTYLSRTEAIAALSTMPGAVVTTTTS
jgi:hypothetical protein